MSLKRSSNQPNTISVNILLKYVKKELKESSISLRKEYHSSPVLWGT